MLNYFHLQAQQQSEKVSVSNKSVIMLKNSNTSHKNSNIRYSQEQLIMIDLHTLGSYPHGPLEHTKITTEMY